jgi:hypothetical protein
MCESQRPACPWLILHDDSLIQIFGHVFREDAHENIRATARGKWHYHGDGPRRIELRARCHRPTDGRSPNELHEITPTHTSIPPGFERPVSLSSGPDHWRAICMPTR